MTMKYFEQTKTMNCPVSRAKVFPFFLLLAFFFSSTEKIKADSFNPEEVWMVEAGPDQNICLGESAQLEASGANSYEWSPATGLSCTVCPNPIANPSSTTQYFVLADDGTIDSVTVSVFTEPEIIGVTENNPTECGLPNGSIVIEAIGAGPLEYSVTGGTIWQNNGVFTALAAGDYEIVVRNVGGACEVEGSSVELEAPLQPSITDTSLVNPTLCDVPNGSIIITASGGISPLEYSIDGGVNWQGFNTFQLLGSGSYDIRVRNNDGSCEVQGGTAQLIGSPDEAFIADIFEAAPSVCGASDGLITVLVTNDDGSFEYSIDGGITYQASNSFPGLTEGIYNIVVRRTDGTCTTNGGFVELTSVNRPTIFGTSLANPTDCNTSDGNVTILAFGTSTLEFSIDGGLTWQGSNIFNGLSGDTYDIAVRNIDGTCETPGGTVELIQPIGPEIIDIESSNPSGCGFNNGSITITANPSTGVQYSINGGLTWQSSNTFQNLISGAYQTAVRNDDGSCSVLGGQVTLTEPSGPQISSIDFSDPSTCGQSDGTIAINATGSATIEYSIDNGSTWQTDNFFTNLLAGTYNVAIRFDDGSCLTGGGIVILTDPDGPQITEVNFSDPSTCGVNDGNITVTAFGTGDLEFSIDGGAAWTPNPIFSNLSGGTYDVLVRQATGACEFSYGLNPVVLNSSGDAPTIDGITVTDPSACGGGDGSIFISASGSGTLQYSIDGGINFQANSTFAGLAAGNYAIVVGLVGTTCQTTATATLVSVFDCTDTVLVTIEPDVTTEYCLDASVFDIPGLFTSVGFCGQGSLSNVSATVIAGECVTLVPSSGFVGVSPDLICTIHCFNGSNTLCDTTYIQVNVNPAGSCDDIWPVDSATITFLGNPTGYCVQVPFSSLSDYDIEFQGAPLFNPFDCDLGSIVGYSYGFLPGGGFDGPYTIQSWAVNGVPFTGTFNDPDELADLMNSFDPTGFWQVNATSSNVIGGNLASSYGDMVVQGQTGPPVTLMTNIVPAPNGFTVFLTDFSTHLLVAIDPATGCQDTLFLVPDFEQPETEVINLTTSVNTATDEVCVDGEDLPLGYIVSLGFCGGPSNGAAPLTNDSCFFYLPNLNFAGLDTFCVHVCDGGFPLICDTTFVVVNVLPETDTVFMNVPPGITQVDTCLDDFIIELPGDIDQASFCGINNSEVTGQIDDNCLIFNPVAGFVGQSEVCVEFCSGGICDVTIVIVNVEPPIVCDDIFLTNPEFISSITNQGFYCIPIPTGDIVGYDIFLDGNLYTDSYAPCDFGPQVNYNYNGFDTGPYELDSWSINGGISFTGSFADIDELVDSMNVWDPFGSWDNNTLGLTILGGDPANTYSDLVLTQVGVGQFTLIADPLVLPLGSQIEINGFGIHTVEAIADNGCTDEVTVIFDQHFVSPETLFFETNLNTTVGPICGNTDELLGDLNILTFCGLPPNGSISVVNDSCLSYTPGLNFSGIDEFCFILCDDFTPQVCDTFYVVVETGLPTDTVFVDANNVTPFDECLDGSVLQLPGVLDTAFICDSNPDEVELDFLGNCVIIDLEDTFVGTTTACVVHCTPDVPPICDTTILVISFDGVFPCDPIFIPDEVLITLENDTGEVCIPVPPGDIGNYDIILDGDPYAGTTLGCDNDLVYTYFYGSVPGQGSVGPYDVEWTANGVFFAGTVNNMQELVDLMNGWDPTGDWVLNSAIFSIQGTNDSNVYGDLIITNSSGIETIIPEPILNPVPLGTQLIISGEGPHEVVLVETGSGCEDTLFINAVDPADIIFINTLENTPSADECVDISGLPGTFDEMTLCDDPENGTIIITDNCFTYLPDLDYVGMDTACVEVCDDLGNCEQFTVIITVEPFCTQFQFFPDDVQEIQVNDCADIAAYCVPVNLDSIFNFGVLDNGFPYSGGFVPCNIDLTQIALDTGFHEVIFVHLNSGCTDTLLANVTCEVDSTGCGFQPLNGLDFCLTNCDSLAELCLDIPVFDIPNLSVIDNGAPFTGDIDECSTMALMTGIQLDTGFHELVIADTVKGCVDTFLVNVECANILDVTQILSIPVGDEMQICLSDFGFPVLEIDSVVNICPTQSDGNANVEFDPLLGCLVFTGVSEGNDVFCMEVYVGCASATVTVIVDVIQPCPDYFPDDEFFGAISCDVDTGLICLPVDEDAIENWVVTVNGDLLGEPLEPCAFDSNLVLNYFEFPGQAAFPPYSIDSWSVNGVNFSGVINSAQELADSMNVWDPTGNWAVVIDPDTGDETIQGGNFGNDYGQMTVTQTTVNITDVFPILTNLTATAHGVQLPLGTSVVEFTDTVTMCSETIAIDVVCVETDVVIDDVIIGSSDTVCLEVGELFGDIVSIENICPDLGGDDVSFTLVDSCVIYTGIEPGLDTACFVVCDDLGVCDTTLFYITSTIGGDSTLVAVDDIVVTGQDEVVLIDVFQNDIINSLLDFFILDEPNNGTVSFLPTGEINYVPNAGYCDDQIPDEFTYVICNATTCDTATVFVTVSCSSLEVFNAFSPNGDEINDFFKITGLQNYPNHELTVYNRWGNQVLRVTEYQNDWFGRWNGRDLPDGTYFYVLDLGEGDKPLSGYVQLHR